MGDVKKLNFLFYTIIGLFYKEKLIKCSISQQEKAKQINVIMTSN